MSNAMPWETANQHLTTGWELFWRELGTLVWALSYWSDVMDLLYLKVTKLITQLVCFDTEADVKLIQHLGPEFSCSS